MDSTPFSVSSFAQTAKPGSCARPAQPDESRGQAVCLRCVNGLGGRRGTSPMSPCLPDVFHRVGRLVGSRQAVLFTKARQPFQLPRGDRENAMKLCGAEAESSANDRPDPLRRDLALVVVRVARDELV